MQARSIIILTFLLFIFAPDKDYTKSRSLPKIQGDPLQTSYLFGIKAPLSKPLLKAHRALGIQHFMTPSGLHLSVFSTLIFLFLKGRAARFLLLLSFYILSLRFHHIDSFQRMLVFAALRPPHPPPIITIFPGDLAFELTILANDNSPDNEAEYSNLDKNRRLFIYSS